MADEEGLTLRRMRATALWGTGLCALAAIGAGVAAGLGVPGRGEWASLSAAFLLTVCLTTSVSLLRRLEAGPGGLRFRTSLRWTRLEWDEITGFEQRQVQPGGSFAGTQLLRAVAVLRGGDTVWLPLPYAYAEDASTFEDDLRALNALHRRYAARATQLP
jgi:hypothetical protein